MTNSSLVRFSRFAFGNIHPYIQFVPLSEWPWKFRATFNAGEIDPSSFRLGIEEIDLRQWRIRHKNYQHDFIWGYGQKTNMLVVMCET